MTTGTYVPADKRFIPYQAPGRMFDWKYPPDTAGARAAKWESTRNALQGAGRAMGKVSAALDKITEALGGSDDATEEAPVADEEG